MLLRTSTARTVWRSKCHGKLVGLATNQQDGSLQCLLWDTKDILPTSRGFLDTYCTNTYYHLLIKNMSSMIATPKGSSRRLYENHQDPNVRQGFTTVLDMSTGSGVALVPQTKQYDANCAHAAITLHYECRRGVREPK